MYSGGAGSFTYEPAIIQFQEYHSLWKELGINYVEAQSLDAVWVREMLAVIRGRQQAENEAAERVSKK